MTNAYFCYTNSADSFLMVLSKVKTQLLQVINSN